VGNLVRGLGALVVAALWAGAAVAQEAEAAPARQPRWYDGFSITPAIGLRHFALHVEQGGNEGSLSNSIQSSFFYALDVQSPSLQLSEHWGVSLYLYSANIDLSEQFTDNDDDGDDNSGESIDVGTRGKGRYSYVVPALHYDMPMGSGQARFALGVGKWIADVSGDIILTPDNQPAEGMPATDFDVSVSKNAYLFHMQWRTASSWQLAMSVGGPTWSQDGYDYKVEEVALTVGYAITPQTFGAP
jgi:hypothetical protein